MSINFKQEELIDELVNTLIKKFPEVEFINISESPEDSESLWINVTSPKDLDFGQIDVGQGATNGSSLTTLGLGYLG
jgi:hypothetical protein